MEEKEKQDELWPPKLSKDFFQLREEKQKYFFPDIQQGQLGLTKSDLLLLLSILNFGPMSPHKFLSKVEAIYNRKEVVFPYVVQNTNEHDRIHWVVQPLASLTELSRKFERLLEADHAPTIRLSNICPECKGCLKKTYAGEKSAKEALWYCEDCRAVFRFSISYENLGYTEE